MRDFIEESGMVLTGEEVRLLDKATDPNNYRISVYDLFSINLMCQQAIGWKRAKLYNSWMKEVKNS